MSKTDLSVVIGTPVEANEQQFGTMNKMAI
jgi:hypothetical protein